MPGWRGDHCVGAGVPFRSDMLLGLRTRLVSRQSPLPNGTDSSRISCLQEVDANWPLPAEPKCLSALVHEKRENVRQAKHVQPHHCRSEPRVQPPLRHGKHARALERGLARTGRYGGLGRAGGHQVGGAYIRRAQCARMERACRLSLSVEQRWQNLPSTTRLSRRAICRRMGRFTDHPESER